MTRPVYDSDLRSLLKTKSTLSHSTSQKQTVSLSHKSIDVDALNNLSAKEVSKKGDEESGDGSASSDHESEKRSKKKSKKKDKKKEKKAKSEKKLKKKYMEAIEEMMKDGKLKDIVNKRFSRSSSRSPPPHPRGSRGGGRSRSRSGSREYQVLCHLCHVNLWVENKQCLVLPLAGFFSPIPVKLKGI